MAYSFGFTTDVASSASSTSFPGLSVTYSAHQRAEVFATYGTDTVVVVTISDGTNAYSLVKRVADGSDTQTGLVYECLDCAAGSFTINGTLASAQPYLGLACTAYGGLDNAAANANNGTDNIAPGTGAGAVTSGTATPGSQPAIVFGYAMDTSGTAVSLSSPGTFTSRGTMANIETTIGVKTRVEDQRVTSTSAIAATFTAGNGSGRFLAFVVIVPESGGGGGGGTPVSQLMLFGVGP